MAEFENYHPHPSLLQPIDALQRAHATQWLVDAYNDDKLSAEDYERRYAAVQAAQNRGQMDAAFEGLLRPAALHDSVEPVPLSALSVPTAPPSPPVVAPAAARAGGFGPALAHGSAFVLWIFGPLLVYAGSRPGSATRREAAKAFNWQLTSFIALIAAVFIDDAIEGRHTSDIGAAVIGIGMLVWFVLTILGMVRAGQGEDWTNPVMRLVRWKPMRER